MIDLKVPEGEKWIELGAGNNPHPACQVHTDIRHGNGIDFVVDLDKPFTPEFEQAVGSDDFHGVLAIFALEHVNWRSQKQCLSEIHRILKHGGRLVLVTPNTEAQLRYILSGRPRQHKDGEFIECSRILFGDNDYAGNSHRSFLSPTILTGLLQDAGFVNVTVEPFGELKTDMVVQAQRNDAPVRPMVGIGDLPNPPADAPAQATFIHGEVPATAAPAKYDPASTFDMAYFDGGKDGGGYGGGGYRDFPCHQVSAQHILARKPRSVVELGCSRGYVLKRIQDAGIPAVGIDISQHCYLTRVCNGIFVYDLSQPPWPAMIDAWLPDGPADLCSSISVLEHLPEDKLPDIVKEMARCSRRGLHGIYFTTNQTDNDKTKRTCRPREWWVNLFHENAPNYPVEILPKDDLENGQIDQKYLVGDGSVKVNIGCATTMFHHGWENVDIIDCGQYAAGHRYNFKRADVRDGLPYNTAGVDLIFSMHHLEHLTMAEGAKFLAECRRVIRARGLLRIIVPDAYKLMQCYMGDAMWNEDMQRQHGYPSLSEFDQLNIGVRNAETPAAKLWALLHENHSSQYDWATLKLQLEKAGFVPYLAGFRKQGGMMPELYTPASQQMLRETTDTLEAISLYCDAVPRMEV